MLKSIHGAFHKVVERTSYQELRLPGLVFDGKPIVNVTIAPSRVHGFHRLT